MRQVEFRGDGGDVISLTLLHRSRPDASDYWDGNWISASVQVTAGGFRGSVSGDLRADELHQFYKQFAQLQESLQGTAEFETMEGWLAIRIVGDGKGRMDLECTVRDQPGIGNTLRFSIASDQTYTRNAVDEWRLVVEAFPVLSEP